MQILRSSFAIASDKEKTTESTTMLGICRNLYQSTPF
jgi:hypothetical protein